MKTRNNTEELMVAANQNPRDRDYWLNQLSGPLTRNTFSYERIEVSENKRDLGQHKFKLMELTVLRLLELSDGADHNLHIILTAILVILLNKFTGSEDITVGAPIYKQKQEIETPLINTILALRIQLRESMTFKALLLEVRETVTRAIEHQNYPMEILLEQLNMEDKGQPFPLFGIALLLESIHDPSYLQHIQPDMIMRFQRSGDGIEGNITYRSLFYTPAAVERVSLYYRRVLRQALANVHRQVSRIEILSPEEKEQLLSGFNNTGADYPRDHLLHWLFQRQAEQTPDQTALCFGDSQLTYFMVDQQANRLAQTLRERRVEPGCIVGLTTDISFATIIGMIAILKAGAAFLPIDHRQPLGRIHYLVKDSQLRLVLTADPGVAQILKIPGMTTLTINNPGPLSGDSHNLEPVYTSNSVDLAYVIYTSGSTGKPKGVMIEHRSIVNQIYGLKQRFFSLLPVPLHHILLAPFTFDPSVQHVFTPLTYGGKLFLVTEEIKIAVDQLVELMASRNIGIIDAVPSQMKAMVESSGTAVQPDLTYIILAGEVFSYELYRQLREGLEVETLINIYGPTEATINATCYECKKEEKTGVIPIGTPLANYRIYILGPRLNLLPVGVPGEIVIAGEGLARGYFNLVEPTHEKFIENPYVPGERMYATGDLGCRLPNGNIEFVGRIDHQIKIRGQRMEPGEIENQLLKHGGVKQAVIVDRKRPSGDKFLCAYIVPTVAATAPSAAQLKEFLALHLPGHMIPLYFIFLEKVPLTAHGKIDLRALPLPQEVRPQLKTLFLEPETGAQKTMARIWEEVLGIQQVGLDDNFFDLGGNSLLTIQLKNKIEQVIKKKIPVAAIFMHMTVRALVQYLGIEKEKEKIETGTTPLKKTKPEKATDSNGLEIAVIGMAGRFPGARNIDELWENLKNGVEAISFFSEEEEEQAGVPGELSRNPNYVKAKGILEEAEYFDAEFFGYIPAEAEIMDPQMRILHECAWNALEDAGYDPYSFQGRIGLYAGASAHFNWEGLTVLRGTGENVDSFSAGQLRDKDFLTSYISYKLDLKGPSITLQTACSTSLAAIDDACRGLLTGACHMALAGGVTINLPQKSGYSYNKGMVFSPDGHCRPFDSRAAGIIGGNGAALVLLKPLAEAVSQGDNIYAVIKGIGIDNDGIRKAGFTAPSVEAQAEAIREALEMAEAEPESIGYIEAHGTGTKLGDPVEIEALKMAFNTDKKNFCQLGSIKSNLGHLDSAAGIASFIKVVLALNHKIIPPTINFENPNPMIDFVNSPFRVNSTLTPWTTDGPPLKAGVNSVGIGGTNVHVVLEEWPGAQSTGRRAQDAESQDYQLILLSANTKNALARRMKDLAVYLKKNPRVHLSDAAYTLKLGRKRFPYRKMVVGAGIDEILKRLAADGDILFSKRENPPEIFMFSGQGSQYVNMGLGLYRQLPPFQVEMDRCFEILKSLLDYDIKKILYPGISVGKQSPPLSNNSRGSTRSDIPHIDQTEIAHLVTFIIEYALARVLMKGGIIPKAMIGYSLGEYTAACLSGVFSLEDALKLVVIRAQLIETLPRGGMLSVPIPIEELLPLLPGELSIAIDNGLSCIVAGPSEKLNAFAGEMKKKRLICMQLPGSHAIHTRMMEPILNQFEDTLGQVKLKKPGIPYISNVTGDWLTAGEATDPAYWGKHLRQTVRFKDGLQKLLEKKSSLFVEVGPGRSLSTLVKQYLDEAKSPIINMVRHPEENVPDLYYLMKQIGNLWLLGAKIDWEQFHQNKTYRRLHLPTYPFQGKSYLIPGMRDSNGSALKLRRLSWGRKTGIPGWFYVPSWKRSGLAVNKKLFIEKDYPGFMVFIDECHLGRGLVKQLEQQGGSVIIVKVGSEFVKEGPRLYRINPGESSHYDALLRELQALGKIPGTIIHLWNVSGSSGQLNPGTIKKTLDLGFYSLLHLARAIEKSSCAGEIRIKMITDGMHEFTGDESICPGKSMVLGPVKVIPQEYSNISCQSIDIVLPEPGSKNRHRVIHQLFTELMADSQGANMDTVVAYRGDYRWVRIFEPLEPLGAKQWENPGESELLIKEGGVYLVTGGLGKIGFLLAQYLAKTFAAKLVLTGRSDFPPREEWDTWLDKHEHGEENRVRGKILEIQELEKSGAEVLVLSADAANFKQMQNVFARAEERFGRLDGVLHCAGMSEDSLKPIDLTSKDHCEEQFRAKVYGTLVLEAILKDKKERAPDFCMLMSSISAVLGGLGFSAYAASNLFMDALVYRHEHKYNRENHCAWISVNWDGWEFIGTNHPLAINPQEGIKAFQYLVTLGELKQVLIAKGDLPERIEHWIGLKSLKEENNDQNESTSLSHLRPQLTSEYAAPRSPVEGKLVEIWQKFFGIEKIGIHDNFFELGGDSLKAMVVNSKIHKEMNAKVSLTVFFKRPNIGELGKYITGLDKAVHTPIKPVEEKEYYPLSPMQKRLYILYRMNPRDTFYNIPLTVILEEKITREKLETVFKKLIKRDESLRTSFLVKDDEPVQKIQRLQRYDEVTFSAGYHEASEEEANRIRKEFSQPFDLGQAPLIRAGLVKTTGRYILVAEMHHIISDGISVNLLEKNFAALFLGKELSPLKIYYKDFSQWHKNETKIIKQQERYWLKEFAGEIPVVNLPADYPRPPLQSFTGSVLNYKIEKETTNALKKLALEQEVTLYMVLLALCYILLAKLSRQEDIIIGTPTAGRYFDDLQPIIGMFVNTLALRNCPHREKTFSGFLQETKKRTLRAFENQEYPFEELVEKVAVNRDLSRNPLFDCMFILHNLNMDTSNDTRAENPGAEVTELKIKRYPRESTNSKFDLTLETMETSDGLLFFTEFCLELFKEETVYRYMKYYKKLALEVLAAPGAKISELEIITPEEKKQLLYEFNETGTDAPTNENLCAWFETRVKNTPDHTALVGAIKEIRGVITYNELNQRSNQLAYLLKERGVPPEALVGLMLNRSAEMIIAVLAILKAGCGCLPLDPGYPAERITYMLKDSGVSILVTAAPVLETMPGDFPGGLESGQPESAVTTVPKNYEILFMDQIAGKLQCYPGENLEPIHNSNNLFYVIYTSGSTGLPKGVILEHGNLANLIRYDFEYTNLDCSKILQFHTLCFDASFHEIFCALLWGGQLVLIDDETRLNAVELLTLVEKNNIKTLFLPMSFLRIIFSEENYIKRIPRCVDHIQTAGEQVIVNDAFREFLKNNRVYLHNHYGPSETHVATALTMDPAKNIPQLPTLGKPISNTAIFILDKARNLTPLAVPGELYIAGTQVGRGYLNNPELTAEKFVQNNKTLLRGVQGGGFLEKSPPGRRRQKVYLTGDLACWLPDGTIKFLGRIDKQIKVRGFRVEPGEIENRLLKHGKIQKAVVVAKADSQGSQYLCAYVVTGEKSFEKEGSTAGELKEYLLHHLPAYMVPAYFLEIKEIPLTPAGKVDRAALSEMEIEVRDAHPSAAPESEIEKKLAKIWSEILGKETGQEQPGQSYTPIGTDDNFFHLGGHSLNVMILSNRVHKELEVILPLNQVFLTPTIKKLARFIQNTMKNRYLSIEAEEEKEYYALSSGQKRLYILQQKELGSIAYNLPEVVPLPETPDTQGLEQTFRKLIRRHEILRTSFQIVKGELVQRIHDEVEFEIEYYHPGAKEGASGLAPLLKSFIRPFDLAHTPLLRVGLVKTPNKQALLLLDLHHIISDAVSHNILVRDFIALAAGAELPGLRLQYKDFSQWQDELIRSGALKSQQEYWLQELSGQLPRLDLPTDYPRPMVQDFEGSEVTFEIEEEKIMALNEMALAKGVTLYMIFLALYNVFLWKLCGQEDIIVGAVGAGRRHADLEQIIGMFVNTLVMRNYPSGEKKFKVFLEEVGKRTIAAIENQDYQFEDLVENLAPANNHHRNPLFDAGFGFLDIRGTSREQIPPPGKNQYQFHHPTSRFDLSLYCFRTGNKLNCIFEYRTSLFKEETITLFSNYFKDITAAISKNKNILLKDLRISHGFKDHRLEIPRGDFEF